MTSSEQMVLNYQMKLLVSGSMVVFLNLIIVGASGNGGFVSRVYGKAMIGLAWG